MSIKLIAIDVDGTLLNAKRELNKKVIEVIRKAVQSDIKIVLCTGRPTPGIQGYIKKLGLNKEEDYSITYNGALLKRTDTGRIISQHGLSYNDFLKLQEAANEAKIHFHVLHNDKIITLNKNISHFTVHESFVSEIPLLYRTLDEIDKKATYSKMMMIDWPEVLEKGIKKLPKTLWDEYTVLRSEPHFLEFLNKKASKGTALKELADRLNISPKNVMAIGDSEIDLDMIEYAGLGVAMGNATEEVKNVAQYTTTTNEENGVAEVINKLL